MKATAKEHPLVKWAPTLSVLIVDWFRSLTGRVWEQEALS